MVYALFFAEFSGLLFVKHDERVTQSRLAVRTYRRTQSSPHHHTLSFDFITVLYILPNRLTYVHPCMPVILLVPSDSPTLIFSLLRLSAHHLALAVSASQHLKFGTHPLSLRTCTSPDTFRHHLKTHYCQQAFQST